MNKTTAANLGAIGEICGTRPSDMLGWGIERPTYSLMCGDKELNIVEFCVDVITNVLRKSLRLKYKDMDKIWICNDVADYEGDRLVFDMMVMGEKSAQEKAEMKRSR